MKRRLIIISALFVLSRIGQAQSFVNLNFEAATNLGTAGAFNPLSATNTFPGWTISNAYIFYDNFSLSGGSISICDTNPPTSFSPIQGKYFALLTSENYPGTGNPISIGQTGMVPLSAESIIFWGAIGGLQVTFDGQSLSFSSLSSTANYTIYGADISAYAGQTGQLLFTLPPYVNSTFLDNIQFSSTPVPEPGTFALAALGVGLLSWQHRKK